MTGVSFFVFSCRVDGRDRFWPVLLTVVLRAQSASGGHSGKFCGRDRGCRPDCPFVRGSQQLGCYEGIAAYEGKSRNRSFSWNQEACW